MGKDIKRQLWTETFIFDDVLDCVRDMNDLDCETALKKEAMAEQHLNWVLSECNLSAIKGAYDSLKDAQIEGQRARLIIAGKMREVFQKAILEILLVYKDGVLPRKTVTNSIVDLIDELIDDYANL